MDFFDQTFDLDAIFGEMGALIFVIDAVVFSQVNVKLTGRLGRLPRSTESITFHNNTSVGG
jgi:hypothetical protein